MDARRRRSMIAQPVEVLESEYRTLLFRQLLSGPGLRPRYPVAEQMVNFVYTFGDRETGEAHYDPAIGPAN